MQKAFSDYDDNTGFETFLERIKARYPSAYDASWHNDSCPSIVIELNDLESVQVFVDYKDESLRETQGISRFGFWVHSDSEWLDPVSRHVDKFRALVEADDYDSAFENLVKIMDDVEGALFNKFYASRMEVTREQLEAVTTWDHQSGGFIFDGGCFVERCGEGFHLHIATSEYTSDSLHELAAILYHQHYKHQ